MVGVSSAHISQCIALDIALSKGTEISDCCIVMVLEVNMLKADMIIYFPSFLYIVEYWKDD